jgi:hypothetical protein
LIFIFSVSHYELINTVFSSANYSKENLGAAVLIRFKPSVRKLGFGGLGLVFFSFFFLNGLCSEK